MQNTPLLIIGAAAVGFAFWLFAPAHTKDKLQGAIVSTTPERRCLEAHRAEFNDPESAYIERSYVWTKAEDVAIGGAASTQVGDLIKVEVIAKNRMGANVRTWIHCPVG